MRQQILEHCSHCQKATLVFLFPAAIQSEYFIGIGRQLCQLFNRNMVQSRTADRKRWRHWFAIYGNYIPELCDFAHT